jgi:hypothetical protein
MIQSSFELPALVAVVVIGVVAILLASKRRRGRGKDEVDGASFPSLIGAMRTDGKL